MQVHVTADEIWPCVQITLTSFQQGLIHSMCVFKNQHTGTCKQYSRSKQFKVAVTYYVY